MGLVIYIEWVATGDLWREILKNIILIVVVFLFACKSKTNENATWVKPESITISCDDYYSLNTRQGVFTNNVWNKHAAKNDAWSQCLEQRSINGDVQFGWSWSWPFGRRVIYSQPQIKIGSSPWAPEPKFDNSFPLSISDLKKLDITHSIEVNSNGDHNTVTTMWLTRSPYKGSEPDPSVIAAEIMIWTFATDGHFSPSGRKRGELTIEDTIWEVWYQKEWRDHSGINNNKWVSVSFRAKISSMQARIPGLELLNYAIQENLIAKNLFIADVELGNEIMSGSGIAWLKDFSVVYEKKI